MSDTPKADHGSDRDDPGAAEDLDETTNPEGSDRGTDGSDGEDRDASDDSEEEAPSAEAYRKLQAKAKRREEALRRSQARIKELEGAKEDEQEDPEARANAKLVRASAKAVLAGAGITDRQDQADVLELINLADIEVDDAGDPDEDEISERIERLRKALGATQAPPRKRTPAGRTATDRGGSESTTLTPDQKRYRAFLNS